jgi:hypothetical protein
MKKDAMYVAVLLGMTYLAQQGIDKVAPEFIKWANEFLRTMAYSLLY